MKNILLLFLALSLFACGDDNEAELHHDGPNQSSPFLEAGIHNMAAVFPADVTNTFNGRSVVSVEYFLLDVPTSTTLNIYGEGVGLSPGELLYSADLSSSALGNTWNTHTLSTPLEISGEELWLVINVEHAGAIQSLGCDAGPARTNGDWISTGSLDNWQTFRDRMNQEVSINWNIRGNLNDE